MTWDDVRQEWVDLEASAGQAWKWAQDEALELYEDSTLSDSEVVKAVEAFVENMAAWKRALEAWHQLVQKLPAAQQQKELVGWENSYQHYLDVGAGFYPYLEQQGAGASPELLNKLSPIAVEGGPPALAMVMAGAAFVVALAGLAWVVGPGGEDAAAGRIRAETALQEVQARYNLNQQGKTLQPSTLTPAQQQAAAGPPAANTTTPDPGSAWPWIVGGVAVVGGALAALLYTQKGGVPSIVFAR